MCLAPPRLTWLVTLPVDSNARTARSTRSLSCFNSLTIASMLEIVLSVIIHDHLNRRNYAADFFDLSLMITSFPVSGSLTPLCLATHRTARYRLLGSFFFGSNQPIFFEPSSALTPARSKPSSFFHSTLLRIPFLAITVFSCPFKKGPGPYARNAAPGKCVREHERIGKQAATMAKSLETPVSVRGQPSSYFM